jgi:8-oxo-dGTP pyrophosphatase MutT (NUDIX family)
MKPPTRELLEETGIVGVDLSFCGQITVDVNRSVWRSNFCV